jgi:hypothetical protein
MIYFEAPSYAYKACITPSLFLAGGITGCPDWQTDAVNMLQYNGSELVILNPRRKRFPINYPDAAFEQIIWEHSALNYATAILFWFPASETQPIALFELGRWSGRHKKLFVGCSTHYPRARDVEIQLRLECPDLPLYHTLVETVEAVLEWEGI